MTFCRPFCRVIFADTYHKKGAYSFLQPARCLSQGTIGCTPNSVPMVFIVFSGDSWGL